MTLIDYLLNKSKGLEKDFILESKDSIMNATRHVIRETDAPFAKTDYFLKFSDDILSGGEIPKGDDRKKYKNWSKYIIETSIIVEQKMYQDNKDYISAENTSNLVSNIASFVRSMSNNKEPTGIRIFTSKLSYDDIEKMSQEELWNLVNIAIENATILASFLNDYNKYCLWEKTSEFGYSDENPSETKEEKPIKDDTVDISGKFMKHPNLYENLKRISKSN